MFSRDHQFNQLLTEVIGIEPVSLIDFSYDANLHWDKQKCTKQEVKNAEIIITGYSRKI